MAEQPKFDLDVLLKTNYEYEPLKKVLEYLLAREKTNSDKLNKIEGDLSNVQKNSYFTRIYALGSSMLLHQPQQALRAQRCLNLII